MKQNYQARILFPSIFHEYTFEESDFSKDELIDFCYSQKKLHPKNPIDFMEKIMSVDLSTLKCVGRKDMKAAQETVNRAESSSKFKEKMENALGILNFINDQHSDKPIKQVYFEILSYANVRTIEVKNPTRKVFKSAKP